MAVGNAGNVGSYLVMTTCPTWTSLTVAGWFKYTANSGGDRTRQHALSLNFCYCNVIC